MNRIFWLATGLSLAVVSGALAQESHDHKAPPPSAESITPDMMQMMMKMHGMMAQGHAGPKAFGAAGCGMSDHAAMMDSGMMEMMMGGAMMSPEMASPKAMGGMAMDRLAEFDADKDGALSLAEFEALHSAMMRETMVDRFQHLDADGDGLVSADEMSMPSRRMEMRESQMKGSGMMDQTTSPEN